MSVAALEALRARCRLSIGVPELQQAFLHRSYVHEHADGLESNDRLEFLGDAVIELVVREHLCGRYPTHREGELTQRKAALVSDDRLADNARTLALDRCLFLGNGEEETGGRDRDSILAAAFEALTAVVFLCEGYERARRFLLEHLHLDPASGIPGVEGHRPGAEG